MDQVWIFYDIYEIVAVDLQLFEHATEHENYTLEMSTTDIYLHNLDFDNAEQVTCVQPLALEFTNDAAWSRNSMVNAWMPSCRTNQGSELYQSQLFHTRDELVHAIENLLYV